MGGVQVGRGGGGGVSVQSMGEMGKDFCPNFLQPFKVRKVLFTLKSKILSFFDKL